MIKKLLASFLFLISFLLVICSCEEEPPKVEPPKNQDADIIDYTKEDYDINIKLETDGNCIVLSSNPIKIKAGDNATFKVLFNENYSFDTASSDNVTFKDGIVTVSGCKTNQTFKITSKSVSQLFTFDVIHPKEEFGSVTSSVKTGDLLENTLISISALPAEGQTFIGWSKNAEALDGGTIVSYSPNYSFTIRDDTVLYPNFLTAGNTIIKYDLNSGTTSDGLSTSIITQFSAKNHYAPNLIADNGMIIRDGYTLLEFTENPDGSGEAINPGGMAKLPEKGAILELYAQWSEWSSASNFMYTVDQFTNEITITAYIANEGVVSIPETIDGKPVTKIAAGAFFGKTFETLIIPKTVVTMEKGAFKSCKNFDILYITDTFTNIKDDAFIDCKKFSNMRLNVSLDPHYVNHAESIGRRLEVIMSRDSSDKPLMIFVGGSSCLYGIKAHVIEAELDYKYQVINAGTNAGGLGVLYMEGMSHYLKEGDVIVNVPEYGNPQMGKTEFAWRTFRATETCYNIYRYADFSKYTNFFTAMSEYNTADDAKNASRSTSYDQPVTSLTDRYCDLARDCPPNPSNTFNAINVKASSLSDSSAETINALYERLHLSGIYYYFSCAPILHEGGNGTLSTTENLKAYFQRTITVLKCPVISTPLDYLYNKNLYNNSAYHLSTEAALIHSEKIADDVKIQLKADNIFE